MKAPVISPQLQGINPHLSSPFLGEGPDCSFGSSLPPPERGRDGVGVDRMGPAVWMREDFI
jgi:hypothetical protein